MAAEIDDRLACPRDLARLGDLGRQCALPVGGGAFLDVAARTSSGLAVMSCSSREHLAFLRRDLGRARRGFAVAQHGPAPG
jgi:hypothetical protein